MNVPPARDHHQNIRLGTIFTRAENAVGARNRPRIVARPAVSGGRRPSTAWNYSRTLWDCPSTAWNYSRTLWDCPSTAWNCSRTLWECPSTPWNCPRTLWQSRATAE
jgi:hypothetical protein